MISQNLDDHASADAIEAIAHFKSLIETRKFKKEQLQEDRVVADLRRLAWAASQGSDQMRLEALSVLGKAAEVSVPIAAAVRPLIISALSIRPPFTGEWGNADDRYYFAKAVSASTNEWTGSYAARELATAGTSEVRSKEVWAELALAHCESIAAAIEEIANGLNSQQSEGPDDPLTPFRRLNRVCESLVYPLRISELPAGPGLGAALRSLFSLTAGSTTAEFVKVREATALSAMDLVITILRLRVDTLFDPEMYRALSVPLNWWRPATPPSSVDDRVNRASYLAVDALLVVARQGHKDVALRRSIVAALGKKKVDEIAFNKAAADPSLLPDVSHWLSTGRELQNTAKNETLEEVLDQEMDELTARLAIERKRLEMTPSDIRQIGDVIEAFEPVHASTIKTLSTHLDVLGQAIDAILRKRGISVSPERDETVKFDPRSHEAFNPIATSADAKVLVPGAVKASPGRPPVILVKAIVK
jgi:molecular chaperone GrpE (heat shock protein)